MLNNLDKKIKTYSYISMISGIFVCVLLIVLTIYVSMNQYSYNIVNADGSVISIPYWPLVFVAIIIGISWFSSMLCAYGVGELLEKITSFKKIVKEENEKYEKEQISEMIKSEKKKDELSNNQGPTVLKSVENPVIVNKQLFDSTPTNVEIEKDLEDGVADYLVTENTMEIENKQLFEEIKQLPNYRLDLSNAFFDRIKPIKLTSEQERAVYENVEQALLTNDTLLLTTTTLEGQKVNVNVPANTLGHVTDNIEALKDALKIFRKLQKIQIAKDFVWKI